MSQNILNIISVRNFDPRPSVSPDRNPRPDDILVHVTSFLYPVEVALLAISRCCNAFAMQAIISQTDWSILDFSVLRKARKITDAELAAILFHINARETVKHLSLEGCDRIRGHGLDPLWRSSIIETIDLTVCRWPLIQKKMLHLRSTSVIPILSSFLQQPLCALKVVNLPIQWQKESQRSALVVDFLTHFNTVIQNRKYKCTNCNIICGVNENCINYDLFPPIEVGSNKCICTNCERPYCDEENNNNDNARCSIKFCRNCDISSCNKCSKEVFAWECEEEGCYRCYCKKCYVARKDWIDTKLECFFCNRKCCMMHSCSEVMYSGTDKTEIRFRCCLTCEIQEDEMIRRCTFCKLTYMRQPDEGCNNSFFPIRCHQCGDTWCDCNFDSSAFWSCPNCDFTFCESCTPKDYNHGCI